MATTMMTTTTTMKLTTIEMSIITSTMSDPHDSIKWLETAKAVTTMPIDDDDVDDDVGIQQ